MRGSILMANERQRYFTAKVSATDFLTALSALYGPVNNLKFEWVEGIMWSLDGKWDAQLTGISKLGMSSTGIEYEIDLWGFADREQELEEYNKIERLFAIANDMSIEENLRLPLSEISVKTSDLQGENKIPAEKATVWLHYGDIG